MSDWQQRTRQTIKLTSPKGNIFEALWRSGAITQEKKLGIFNYPKIFGSVVQDLGVNSTRYPMIIYFEGPNNDIESQRFMAALNEYGSWTVIHPVLGEKILQPISFSPDINPTASGNITVVTTEWIEPISDAVITSIQELEARIQAQQAQLNAQGASQFSEVTSQVNAGETLAIAEESTNILTAFNQTIDDLSQVNSDIYNEVTAIKRGIDETIQQPIINILSLFGQFQQLTELPALVVNDFQTRFDTYANFITEIFQGEVSNTSTDKNIAATKESILSNAISTMGTISITSEFQTRSQIVQAIEDIATIFLDITNYLDNIQNIFNDNLIDNQFFSQSQTFSDAALLIGYITVYLLKISFDLKIEKRFKLEKDRAPIEITITEYGNLGENESNLDLFLSSNNLKGNDILLLPSGREVVVYV